MRRRMLCVLGAGCVWRIAKICLYLLKTPLRWLSAFPALEHRREFASGGTRPELLLPELTSPADQEGAAAGNYVRLPDRQVSLQRSTAI